MKFLDVVKSCVKCKDLSESRTNVVVGEGPVPCPLVFLGEAPGKVEDQTGRPFVGMSGNHLRTLLYHIGLSEKQYHILNLLKCRPPDNRDPRVVEVENCRTFLEHQLSLIQPKVIVAMGRYPQAFVLGKSAGRLHVTKNAGKVVPYNNTQALLTYHPAFVLRNKANDVEKAFRRHLRKGKRLAYDV